MMPCHAGYTKVGDAVCENPVYQNTPVFDRWLCRRQGFQRLVASPEEVAYTLQRTYISNAMGGNLEWFRQPCTKTGGVSITRDDASRCVMLWRLSDFAFLFLVSLTTCECVAAEHGRRDTNKVEVHSHEDLVRLSENANSIQPRAGCASWHLFHEIKQIISQCIFSSIHHLAFFVPSTGEGSSSIFKYRECSPDQEPLLEPTINTIKWSYVGVDIARQLKSARRFDTHC